MYGWSEMKYMYIHRVLEGEFREQYLNQSRLKAHKEQEDAN